MKKVKVTDYLKASKDPAATLDCFVRFKINRLDDGKLVLIRNKMNESGDFGSLSSSLILSKSGRIVKTQEKIAGVATFDDIEQMLNNCYVSLDVFESDWEEFLESQKGGIELGGSILEYGKSIGYDEGENAGLAALSLSYLNTHKSHRQMGLARRMIANAEKLAWFNDYKLLCGIGVPLEKGFSLYNKSMQEMGFYVDYEKQSTKNGYTYFNPLSGVVDLAIFYSRLGFNIYPMGESFVIEKKVENGKPTKKDEAFFKAQPSKLDKDIVLFER